MNSKPFVSIEAQSWIESRLAAISKEHQVNILYACESGSRAWGFPSPDSDYDVRFIYAHPWAWYLALEEGDNVIHLPIEDSPAGLLDLGGWDLRKTLRLLRKSNPVIWEWLQSLICYQPGQTGRFRELRSLFDPFYSPISSCHHYLSICRNTKERELSGGHIKIKKYFYMLRPLLAAAWIEQHRAVPPMELAPLLRLLDDQPEIINCIDGLMERKQHTDEQIPITRIPELDMSWVNTLSCLPRTTLPASNYCLPHPKP
ncbi:MAG: nucleotidyltransferase domain-containing protein [Methylobacter sp.]